MKQAYKRIRFKEETLLLIQLIDRIVEDYQAQDIRLTVRGLYYQLVALDAIPNSDKSYNRIKSVVNDARMAGMLDWDAFEDLAREFIRTQRWRSEGHILEAASSTYHMDLWVGQKLRPFVIVEKAALSGVLSGICREYDAPLLAARGYPSVTVLREFVLEDLIPTARARQYPIILHLGDHDPSGIDMTRDLRERVETFMGGYPVRVIRVALTMAQIEVFNPPPNRAKETDARYEDYCAEFGVTDSWELDAMPPRDLIELMRATLEECIDSKEAWKGRLERVVQGKRDIASLAAGFKPSDGGSRRRYRLGQGGD